MSSNIFLLPIVFFLLFVVPALNVKKLTANKRRKTREKLREKGCKYMVEMIKKYLGKDCIIYCGNSFSEHVDGIIEEVTDEWVSINVTGSVQIIKIEYISRIREYPHNAKGNRTTVWG